MVLENGSVLDMVDVLAVVDMTVADALVVDVASSPSNLNERMNKLKQRLAIIFILNSFL